MYTVLYPTHNIDSDDLHREIERRQIVADAVQVARDSSDNRAFVNMIVLVNDVGYKYTINTLNCTLQYNDEVFDLAPIELIIIKRALTDENISAEQIIDRSFD